MQTKQQINEIEINGIQYVRKDSTSVSMDTDTMSLVRSESAGVFFGYVKEHDRTTGCVVMNNARRVWYWSGAASLSQLAIDGTSKPKDCKFPAALPVLTIAKVIEVIPMTSTSAQSLSGVPVWKE